ncbi:TolC family protein [Ideonella sp. 4Y11]|uniref:TolC family protein n=1 Tax=Ideonella aquatica TaxID=2824119 RepID=A0A940YNE1_9BURK|nr:TolC family protein [Ideonella aquatica]MBQ0961787.1 TolC family protein [Ideonella aquatica]
MRHAHTLLLVASVLLALPTHAEPTGCQPPAALAQPAESPPPRQSLVQLLALAEQRSQAIGAARLLTEAAQSDLQETQAAKQPQAQLSWIAGATGSRSQLLPSRSDALNRPSVQVGAPLWDGGRQQALEDWRTQLAEAARQGQLNAAEQLRVQVVNLAFDRSRYRLQAQVWQQYTHKVCTLVQALEDIVARDRGRASELIQARKQLQQVQLSRQQALSAMQLTDTRLRRYVGEYLPDVPSLAALMTELPELPQLHQRATGAAEVLQLEAQQHAAEQLANATAASQRPQVSWAVQASRDLAGDRQSQWQAGVTLSLPLFNPSAAPAERAARQRAEAARLQREDTLATLLNRIDQVHGQAEAAFTRAQDVVQVLRDSERVRDDTLQMWQQLGRRSLFDVMSAEGDHFSLRLAYVDALHDGQQSVALLWSLAGGVQQPLR